MSFFVLKDLVSEREMDQFIKGFGHMLNTTSSVYFDNQKNHGCRTCKMIKDAIYYFFRSKKAKNIAHLFYSNPDVETAVAVIR